MPATATCVLVRCRRQARRSRARSRADAGASAPAGAADRERVVPVFGELRFVRSCDPGRVADPPMQTRSSFPSATAATRDPRAQRSGCSPTTPRSRRTSAPCPPWSRTARAGAPWRRSCRPTSAGRRRRGRGSSGRLRGRRPRRCSAHGGEVLVLTHRGPLRDVGEACGRCSSGRPDRFGQRERADSRRVRRREPTGSSPSRGLRGEGRQRRQTRSSGGAFRLLRSTHTKITISQISASGNNTIGSA